MSAEQEEIGVFRYPDKLEPRQIRLIQLSSDPVKTRMKCTFTHVSLDNLAITYKAISYCWGDASPTERIWVDENHYIEINSSAAEILMAIAAQKSERYFWIDSICIDQKDVIDRNKQVPLMGEIYSHAADVVAWLGLQSEDSDLATRFTAHLHKIITDLFRRKVPVTMRSLTLSEGCEFPSPHWTALARFLQRPWFQRVWIIQEIVLANDIWLHCGSRSLQWKGLADVIVMISGCGCDRLLCLEYEGQERLPSEGVLTTPIVYAIKSLKENNSPRELHFLLQMSYYFKATDPLDNIYGLLGMATDAERYKGYIDYEKSPQEVFQGTTCKMLIENPFLDVLHAAGIGATRRTPGLPSWVPDWGSLPRRTILGSTSKTMLYAASGATNPRIRIDQENKMMTLAGNIFDTITSILPQKPPEPVHNSVKLRKHTSQKMQAWLVEAFGFARSSKQYNNELGRDKALCAALTANVSSTNFPSPARADDYKNFLSWTKMIDTLGSVEDGILDTLWEYIGFPPDEVLKAQAFVHLLVMSGSGKRRVFITDKGYLGLGPEDLEQGDLIVIFHGAAMPFVIRRQAEESNAEMCALVGEGYVHGIMNGEGLDETEEQQIVLG